MEETALNSKLHYKKNLKGELHHVEIDLSEVEFIDSSGIDPFLSIKKRIKVTWNP